MSGVRAIGSLLDYRCYGLDTMEMEVMMVEIMVMQVMIIGQ